MQLKQALCQAPLLQLPDFSRRFIVDCDASRIGFGAVLHQGDGAVAFFSKAIASHHSKLPAYERELIGLVKAVRHWRPYLWGRAFTLQTDHYSLKFILDQRLSTVPQHTWVSKYDITVEYRSGKLNTVADALSRRDEEHLTLHTISAPIFQVFDVLREEGTQDDESKELKKKLQEGTAARRLGRGGWPTNVSVTCLCFRFVLSMAITT